MKLRDYQQKALEAAFDYLHNDDGNGLVGDSLGFMLDFGREQMFEDEHHRTCNRVIEFMKRNKNQAERREVMRALHLSKRQMDEVQDTLGTANGSGKLLFDAAKKPVVYTLAR